MKIGVLLINLGTPDAPTPEAVGRYLREFLMDGSVIDLPKPLRWFLVNLLIVPRRKHLSAEAYQKIQLSEGSPLLVNTRQLTAQVSKLLSAANGSAVVEFAMRYGQPSIGSALARLKSAEVSRIIVLPLYPQFADSSYQTAVEETKRRAESLGIGDRLYFIPPFYNRLEFIESFAQIIREYRSIQPIDHYVFSFHGLPVRHLQKLDASGSHCLIASDCCARVSAVNQNCYRAQCMATARLLAEALKVSPDKYTVSFQSRLGRAKWIEPNTEDVLKELAARGTKKVAVACPSFVADCLETLEEIAIRGRETFIEAGGEELILIPSLNSREVWAKAIAGWIREAA